MEDAPSVLDRARSERDRLTTRIADMQAELAELDVFIRVYERLEVERPRARVRLSTSTLFETESASAREQTRRAADFFETVLETGGWKSTPELFELLEQEKIELTARNPRHRVAQILSADARFHNDRSKGWTLKRLLDPVSTLTTTSTLPLEQQEVRYHDDEPL